MLLVQKNRPQDNRLSKQKKANEQAQCELQDYAEIQTEKVMYQNIASWGAMCKKPMCQRVAH